MTIRVFGAVLGAGTQVREDQGAKPIADGPLGSVIFAGIFRSGPRTLLALSGLAQYRRVYGGLTQDSEAPLNFEDAYTLSEEAIKGYGLRITDGSEVKAAATLYTRKVQKGVLERFAHDIPAAAFVFTAWNGGRWAGRRRRKHGDVSLGSAITGDNTVNLGTISGLKKDEWKGATISFPNDDASFTAKVTGNTAAGVFTIDGTWTDAIVAGTDGRYTLDLANVHELTGKPENLAIEIADGGQDPSGQFEVRVTRDGASVKAYQDIEIDPTGDAYWASLINDDLEIDNFEIEVTDNLSGLADKTDPYNRPANFAEIARPGALPANNQVRFQTVRWTHSSGSNDAYLDTVNDFTHGSDPIELTIVLTFTSGTNFDVTATTADGQTIAALPAGAIGTPYTSQHASMPAFTISDGGTNPSAGHTITIYVRPLPPDLQDRGAYFYPAATPADGDVRQSYRVVANTYDTITLGPSVDISSVVIPPGAPVYTGTVAGPYDLSSGTKTVIFSIGGSGPFTLTSSLSGAATTAAALAADLQTQEETRAGSAAAALVTFSATTDLKIRITARQDFGEIAVLTIGAGGLNTKLGFTTSATATGTEPTVGRLQWRQELGGGYDGIAEIDDDDYEAAWDIATSPCNVLIPLNTGVVKCCMPGVSSAGPQQAMMEWAYTYNMMAREEIPQDKTTEAAAIAWHEANLAIGPAQDYHCVAWPSYGYRKNPYGTGLYLAPMTGAIIGAEAKKAKNVKGYHVAGAGEDVLISSIYKDLPTGDTPLNNEVLNSYGLQEIRKRGSRIFVWGDRVPGDGVRGFLHERLTKSQIGRVLLTNTGSLTFSLNNRSTWASLKVQIIKLFTPWFVAGWFDDSAGSGFSDQVSVKVDETNNTPATKALGDMNAQIGFDVVGTAERTVFTIGSKGVQESAAA